MNHAVSGKIDNPDVSFCLRSQGLASINTNPNHSLERCVVEGLRKEIHQGESVQDALERYGFVKNKESNDSFTIIYTEDFGNNEKRYTRTEYIINILIIKNDIKHIKINENVSAHDGRQAFETQASF